MIIELKGINKTYFNGAPLHVLKGIDLSIEEGEMVSIMGASGSGKSTLLNILGILDTYDTGEYYLSGQLIKNLNETRAAMYRKTMQDFVAKKTPAQPWPAGDPNVNPPPLETLAPPPKKSKFELSRSSPIA